MSKKIEKFDSIPVVNFLNRDKRVQKLDDFLYNPDDWMASRFSNKKFLLEMFGKQSYCWKKYNIRFWIWEREFTYGGKIYHWRIFNSSQGSYFEVEGNLNQDVNVILAGIDHFIDIFKNYVLICGHKNEPIHEFQNLSIEYELDR